MPPAAVAVTTVPASWPRELSAGAISAVTVAAVPLTLGMLTYAGLGPGAAQVGIPAAFATMAVGGTLLALLGGSRMPTLGPSAATALILAGLVHRVLADSTFDAAAPGAMGSLVAVASSAVALMGLLTVLFGLTRLGTLVRYVPRPVLSGFMNGVALMIILAQLPALLGIAPPAALAALPAALAQWQPATLAVGIVTALLMAWIALRWPQGPASLIALGAGALLYLAVARLLPGAALGGTTGALPAGLPAPDALQPLLQGADELLVRHAGAVVATALALAVIGSLESLLNMAAIDQDALGPQHDPNRELIAIGASNVAVALFGGLPGPHLRLRAVAVLQLGGRTRRAALAGAVASGLLLWLAAPLIAALPRVVLAAIMMVMALALFDRWTWHLLRLWRDGERAPDLRPSLLVIAAVLVATVFAGFALAVLLGVLLSMVLFIRSMNRSLVRARWNGTAHPSRRVYGPRQEALLRDARTAIGGVELEGALYFGSVERLSDELEDLRVGCRFLVLDLRRVNTLEASGVATLLQLARRLEGRGVRLVLAGLQGGPQQALRAFGGAALVRSAAPDADRAVECAERQLLAEAGAAVEDAVPLAQSSLLQGLDATQVARIAALLQPRRLAAGERLFAEGDPGDALFVVSQGSINVLAATGDGPQHRARQRYAGVSAGMMLGETALLDGGGRTADAVAEGEALVHRLGADELAALRASDPGLAAALLLNIAIHLSRRLRAAAGAWRDHAV